MRGWRVAALVLVLCSHGPVCRAGDRVELRAELDLRLVNSQATPSFLEGGLGRQRFDGEHEGLRLGRAFATARVRIGDTVTANAVLGTYGDHDKNPIDLTEAY